MRREKLSNEEKKEEREKVSLVVSVCIDKRGEGAQRYLLVLQITPEPEFLNF
jgi:hypothetical protein